MHPLDESARLQIIRWSRGVVTGTLDSNAYLSRLEDLTGGDIRVDKLERRILDGAVCSTALIEILEDLSGDFNLWLLADLPPSWVAEILEASHLNPLFPSERKLDRSINDEARNYKDFIQRLIQIEELRPGSTLLVDQNARRSSIAIRLGLDVAIYVDPRRLRRDFGLWEIFPFDV